MQGPPENPGPFPSLLLSSSPPPPSLRHHSSSTQSIVRNLPTKESEVHLCSRPNVLFRNLQQQGPISALSPSHLLLPFSPSPSPSSLLLLRPFASSPFLSFSDSLLSLPARLLLSFSPVPRLLLSFFSPTPFASPLSLIVSPWRAFFPYPLPFSPLSTCRFGSSISSGLSRISPLSCLPQSFPAL